MLHRHALRVVLLIFGFVFLALAVVGTLLPIMPTVPFLLLAIWCFSRSSERMHHWILNLPKVGAELRAWEEQGAISKHAKVWCAIVMIGLVALPMLFRDLALWVKLAAWTITVLVLVFVWSRPLPRPKDVRHDEG